MTDFNTDIDIQLQNFEPITLIDEQSSEEYYIGVSTNGSDISEPYWRIKKIWKDGTVWKIQFPNGDQSYKFIWDDRISGYTYL